jgi:hypothetical protein
MAYTKYSLTPTNNNAAPPDGAPEGMLPSAVNDTMRDMMAQIRDVGDGIRGGTYTMTAPVITGGSISGLSSLASTGVATFSAGSASAPAITTTGDTNTGIFFPAADTIAFSEGGAEAMRIDSSGNLGIGTTSPAQKLDVNGSVKSTGFYIGTTGTSGFAGLGTTGSATDGGNFVGRSATSTFNAGGVEVYTGGAERMRIDSSGNVLVGTTTTFQSGTMSIQGTSASEGVLSLRNSGATGTTWRVGPQSGGVFVIYNQNSNGVYLISGQTSWTANSDERLKTDLKPIENALEKVSSLRAGTGRYLNDDEGVSRSFLIAQDVQNVFPEAVDVQEDEQGTLGLRYTDVIPLLVASIKELKATVDAQAARIAALESK